MGPVGDGLELMCVTQLIASRSLVLRPDCYATSQQLLIREEEES